MSFSILFLVLLTTVRLSNQNSTTDLCLVSVREPVLEYEVMVSVT